MFKPIKDFLTFIQKSSNTRCSESEIDEDPNNMDDKNESYEINNSLEEKESYVITTSNVVLACPNCDEDDIELQIQSSIMIKNAPPEMMKSSTPSPTPSTTTSNSSITCSPCTSTLSKTYGDAADYNQNLQEKFHHVSPEEDDELADFKCAPLLSSSYEDLHSLHSTSEEQINKIAEKERTDENEDSQSTITVKREIFVIVDNDLNSSIGASSVDDPLAIDINSLPDCCDQTLNPLDSSASEEPLVNELNWVDDKEKPSTMTINYAGKLPTTIEIERNSKISARQRLRQRSENFNNKHENTISSSRLERNEEIERYDNSDSGLGIETSSLLLHSTLNSSSSATESASYEEASKHITSATRTPLEEGTLSEMPVSSSHLVRHDTNDTSSSSLSYLKPLRSNLKRRRYCDVTDAAAEPNCLSESSSSSNTLRDQSTNNLPKKTKRSINFDTVNVYYFPRQQGFGCVPSAGGCTLGMGDKHIDFKRLTLAEHAAELRRAHRLQLQEVNPRGSSSEETDESEEDYLSEGSGSDLDADSNGFLQPVTPRQRRAILKAAGIRKIDTNEKIECRNIRNSREICGCTCRDFCDPETCSCSRAGIKCQVDRAMFPCGCSRDACGNTTGRVEFNPARVRTHFIHTIMRLDMENRQQQQPPPPPMTLNGTPNTCAYEASSTPSSASASASSTSLSTAQLDSLKDNSSSISNRNGYYMAMQTQSNYSSGYASPAYSNEHNVNFYQQQQQQPIASYATATNGTEINETPYHSLDSVDSSVVVFASNTPNSEATYAEILPNYCANIANGGGGGNVAALQFNTTGYNNSLVGYTSAYLPAYEPPNDTASNYLTQSQECATTNHNNNNNNNNNHCIVNSAENIFSSCSAAPSQESFDSTAIADNNFINLNTPIASSSRLSQINDLLQHNRSTTAALVAVSQLSGADAYSNTANSCDTTTNISNINGGSIENPINSEGSKGASFPNAASNIVRAPLPAAFENSHKLSQQNNPLEIAIPPRPPPPPKSIEYDNRVAVADYTI